MNVFGSIAALSFASPVMLVGLLAAGIPVALHLLNRVRSPIVQFPTLRFLRITAQKTSRRRQVQNFLLLLLRMAVFAMIAMAVAGPLVHGGRPILAYGMVLLLLVGLGLLAVTGTLLGGMIENRQRAASAAPPTRPDGTPALQPSATPRTPPNGRTPGFILPIALLVAGLLAAATAVFGLGTDTLFPASAAHFDGSSTACVIILDNSQSMLAHAGLQSRLAQATAQVQSLISSVIRPAQVAVLLTNPGSSAVTDHLSANRVAVLGRLGKIQSTGRTLPMQLLIARSVRLLRNSDEASRLLVIVSDFAGPAAADTDMFRALKRNPEIQVVLMPQATGSIPDDVGITKLNITRGQPVIGSKMIFKAAVINNGQTAVVPTFDLQMDGRTIPGAAAHIQLGPAGTASARGSVKLSFTLPAAGYHLFAVRQAGASDALGWADQRSLMLRVAHKIRVLVVGTQASPLPGSTGFFTQAALAPFAGAQFAAAGKPLWSIAPTYVSAADFSGTNLDPYAAVFMCDVPRLTAPAADSLSRFVRAGGRVCWLLGPAVNKANYNSLLAGTRQMLPGTLTGPMQNSNGSPVSWVDIKSHIFAHLFPTQTPFQRIVVVGRWALPANSPAIGKALSRLEDQSLLLVEHTLGQGRVYTFLTAPGGGWTNIATTSAFLPMIVRIALGSAGTLAHLTSYEPQQAVSIPLPNQNAQASLNVTVPGSDVPVNVKSIPGPEGRPEWIFQETYRAGVYKWESFDHHFHGRFVVNNPGAEVDLRATSAKIIAKEAPVKSPPLIAATARQLQAVLQKNSQGSSLMPGILALVLILAVLEALAANRYKPTVQRRDDLLGREPDVVQRGSLAALEGRSVA